MQTENRNIRDVIKEYSGDQFYAIDLFDETLVGFWGDRRFEESGLTHQQWYENRFSKELKNGKLKIKKGISWEVGALDVLQ